MYYLLYCLRESEKTHRIAYISFHRKRPVGGENEFFKSLYTVRSQHTLCANMCRKMDTCSCFMPRIDTVRIFQTASQTSPRLVHEISVTSQRDLGHVWDIRVTADTALRFFPGAASWCDRVELRQQWHKTSRITTV